MSHVELGPMFKIDDVISERFVKISYGNTCFTNTLLFLLKKM